MQQVSLFSEQTTQTGAPALPFSFGMPAEESKDFYNLLQQTVSDLQEGTLDNSEISDQLNLIKQNIPDDLMTKLEQELNLDEDASEEDELSAKVFAVLNLIDNIIEDIEKIETKPQLQESMEYVGVSENNIKTAFNIIEEPTSNAIDQIAVEESSTLEQPRQIANNIIAQFKTNELPANQLGENILTGKQINQDLKPQENKAITQTNEQELATQQLNAQTTKPDNTTKESKFTEILSLFKKTKETATNEGLNLDKPKQQANNNVNSDITANKTAETTAGKTAIDTSKLASQLAPQEATQPAKSTKTNAEINKSEFKELASKFISQLSGESSERTESTEEVKAPNNTIATHFNANKTSLDIKQSTSVNNTTDIADFEIQTSNTDIPEPTEAKPLASNFNMQLYKLAQQTNIQNQINVAIKNFKAGNQQIKVKLNPEELGSVTIEMEMIDNMAKGIITVERPEVAQHLAQNLNKMFEGFKQAGINISAKDIVVQVDDQAENKQQPAQHNNDEQEKTIELNLTEDELDIKV